MDPLHQWWASRCLSLPDHDEISARSTRIVTAWHKNLVRCHRIDRNGLGNVFLDSLATSIEVKG